MSALTRWRPWQDMETLEHRMEDLFDRFGGRLFGPGERSMWDKGEWSPALEGRTENGNFIVKADLPGIDPKDVSISVTGNQLRIEGERKQDEKKEGQDYFYHEVAYGKFARTMTLPAEVDTEQVKAHYKDGVLEISMPAPKELIAKKISIEAS